jgi:hypothetical protein
LSNREDCCKKKVSNKDIDNTRDFSKSRDIDNSRDVSNNWALTAAGMSAAVVMRLVVRSRIFRDHLQHKIDY